MASSNSSSSSQTTKKGRSMDEVWKDIIGLPSLTSEKSLIPISSLDHDHHHKSSGYKPGMILQVNLAGTFNDVLIAAPLPPPLPVTALSLSSSAPVAHSGSLLSKSNSSSTGVDGRSLLAYNIVSCSATKKRAAAVGGAAAAAEEDRRHKRMIKNRESGSRSRARKQAYTMELEREVSNVQEENSRLRRQLEELRSLMAAQMRLKSELRRTSSAPF